MSEQERLIAWRRQYGYSEQDLAAELGVCEATLKRWETGEPSPLEYWETGETPVPKAAWLALAELEYQKRARGH
jgi:transcriptional regulator with XRE-family HTH domain